MPVPALAVIIAATVTRALAREAAKQGVKQLAKNEARIVARKAVRQIAAKSRSQGNKSRAVSGKQLDALINRANASSRSTKPVRNAKGLRTTTGQGRTKITKGDVYQAVKGMSTNPNKGSGNVSSVGTIKRVQGKPGVRITTRTSRGTSVTRPVRRYTNKNGSAITIRKTTPRKPAEVRAEKEKLRRERLRNALTPRVNPARVKVQPKRGVDKSSRDYNVEGPDTKQGITVRGKFYPDGNPGLPARGSARQGTIESRVSGRAERPTYGTSRRGEQGEFDSEAEKLLNTSLRNLTSPKAAAKNNKVKPGKPTKTTVILRTVGGNKGAKTAKLKGTIRNQRKVLREREVKEAAERMRKAEEAAKKRGNK